MNAGLLKHPYFGQTKVFTQNHRRVLEIKVDSHGSAAWLQLYAKYRTYHWKYCLFPDSVTEVEDSNFKKIDRSPPLKRVQYNGYFATSLRDQILSRFKSSVPFQEQEMLYLTYSIALAWDEWEQFCQQNHLESDLTISSQHILLNQEGDIKLIIPISSPIPPPSCHYYAPENVPPIKESSRSWNKSICFAIGLIGIELITSKPSETFYYLKNQQVKFNFDEHNKWAFSCCHKVSEPIFNLFRLLIDPNPWTRLKLGEFKALLKPYAQNILQGTHKTISRQESYKCLLEFLKNPEK